MCHLVKGYSQLWLAGIALIGTLQIYIPSTASCHMALLLLCCLMKKGKYLYIWAGGGRGSFQC